MHTYHEKVKFIVDIDIKEETPLMMSFFSFFSFFSLMMSLNESQQNFKCLGYFYQAIWKCRQILQNWNSVRFN